MKETSINFSFALVIIHYPRGFKLQNKSNSESLTLLSWKIEEKTRTFVIFREHWDASWWKHVANETRGKWKLKGTNIFKHVGLFGIFLAFVGEFSCQFWLSVLEKPEEKLVRRFFWAFHHSLNGKGMGTPYQDIAIIMYKVKFRLAPSYIQDLFSTNHTAYNLRVKEYIYIYIYIMLLILVPGFRWYSSLYLLQLCFVWSRVTTLIRQN